MSHEYTLNTFVRMTPNELLKEYFARRGLLADFDFESINRRDVSSLVAVMEGFDEKVRSEVDQDFQDIAALSTRKGPVFIADEAEYAGLEVAEDLAKQENDYGLAMWVWLNHNPGPSGLFQRSLLLALASEMRWPRSKRRRGIPSREPATDLEVTQALSGDVVGFFRRQGRGRRCVVEYFQRRDPVRHLYMAYPEDYTQADLQIDEGQLARHPRRPVFEIGFCYRPDEGTLEVHAPGPDRDIEALQALFCRHVLGLGGLPERPGKLEYDLEGLKSPSMAFPTDPEDGIVEVAVMALRLNDDRDWSVRLTFEVKPLESRTIWDVMANRLAGGLAALDRMTVSQAKFRFTFAGPDGTEGSTFSFTVTRPDSSTLKDDPRSHLAKKYLKRWRIAAQ